MSEKKELNQEQLEKVSGGGKFAFSQDIVWLFGENAVVNVKLDDNTLVEGKVTKRGYFGIWYELYDAYYIESTINTNVNGWYSGDDFNNKVVGINKKFNSNAIRIVAW